MTAMSNLFINSYETYIYIIGVESDEDHFSENQIQYHFHY